MRYVHLSPPRTALLHINEATSKLPRHEAGPPTPAGPGLSQLIPTCPLTSPELQTLAPTVHAQGMKVCPLPVSVTVTAE